MPSNLTDYGDEVDTLTASVQLDNGVHTNNIKVDLTTDASKESGQAGYDLMDCSSPIVEVSTYMKEMEPKKRTITVKVRDAHGQNVPFEMLPKDTVWDLKMKVSKKTKIHYNGFYLTFGATSLEDGRPLCLYSIENNSVLTMRIRQTRGG